jgi:hypothetical protein
VLKLIDSTHPAPQAWCFPPPHAPRGGQTGASKGAVSHGLGCNVVCAIVAWA